MYLRYKVELKGIQEYLQNKINFTVNLTETMKFLIFLKLNAWYTLIVLETVEHSSYNKIFKQILMLI